MFAVDIGVSAIPFIPLIYSNCMQAIQWWRDSCEAQALIAYENRILKVVKEFDYSREQAEAYIKGFDNGFSSGLNNVLSGAGYGYLFYRILV